jgi:hypothetical protein
MITELSKEQTDKLIDYGLKWTKIGLSTEPVNMVEAMEAIKAVYKDVGLSEPPRSFLGPFNNPVECAKAQVIFKRLPEGTDLSKLEYLDIPEGSEFTADELYQAIDEQVYGFHESSWLGYCEFLKDEFDIPELASLNSLMHLASVVGWWAPYDKVAFVQHRPLEVHLNEKGELHNENGPALKWRGDDRSFDVYCINGEVQPPPT